MTPGQYCAQSHFWSHDPLYPKYRLLRETYLPAKFYNCPRLSFPLAIYISKAFELRVRANSITISNVIQAWSSIKLYCCWLLCLFLCLKGHLRVYVLFVCVRTRVCCVCASVCIGICVCVCIGRESLLKCLDVMIVYAHKMFLPTATSLFDMGRWPSSINHSFIHDPLCDLSC